MFLILFLTVYSCIYQKTNTSRRSECKIMIPIYTLYKFVWQISQPHQTKYEQIFGITFSYAMNLKFFSTDFTTNHNLVLNIFIKKNRILCFIFYVYTYDTRIKWVMIYYLYIMHAIWVKKLIIKQPNNDVNNNKTMYIISIWRWDISSAILLQSSYRYI